MNALTRRRVVLHAATMVEPIIGPVEPFVIHVSFPAAPVLQEKNLPAEVSVAAFARDGDACVPLGTASASLHSLDWVHLQIGCQRLDLGSWTIEAIIEVRAPDNPYAKRRVLRGVSVDQVRQPSTRG